MALITPMTYPFILSMIIAGIVVTVYSLAKDLLAGMQPEPLPEQEPKFDELSPQEKADMEARARAEKVRVQVMAEKQRQASVTSMLDEHFGDPKPQEEPTLPPKKWWQL